ncbi:MAG: Eco57I restriction-modification methylase domain-containing protein, partial [Nitrospirales bacterium]
FVHERALPDLGQNIKCGNSLIGPDYFAGQLMPDEEEMRRVNPFDWKADFPEIMKAGGFNAVIGNPPYIRSQTLGADQREYYGHTYQTATATYDIYVLFVEKAVGLANNEGRSGFILPNKFFTTDYGCGLRKILVEQNLLEKLVDFEDAQVFHGAGTYTTLLFMSRSRKHCTEYARLGAVYRESGSSGLASALTASNISFAPLKLPQDGSRWTLSAGSSGKLLNRLQEMYPSFATLSPHVFQGLKTSADKVYMVSVEENCGPLLKVMNGLNQCATLEQGICRPMVKGENIQRYSVDRSKNLAILYPYSVDAQGRTTLIGQQELSKQFPKAWHYLNEHKKALGARDGGKWATSQDWYAYARGQNIGTFVGPKFLIPYMTTRLRTFLDEGEDLFLVNITTGGYGLRLAKCKEHRYYFLAILNSALMNHCIQQMTSQFRGGYFAVNKQGLERLPTRTINFADPTDKAKHDQMVSLVERMLDLHKRVSDTKTPAEKERVQRQIGVTDQEIDRLVYDLYGLTEEEIKIVEAASVASSSKVKENDGHESESESADRSRSGRRTAATVAQPAQYAGEGGSGAPESPGRAGEPVHGVREPAGQYGSPQDPDGGAEGQSELGSTREFETAEGRLSYQELSERLAVPLVAIYDEILQSRPDQSIITSEWLCLRHKRLAGHLYPDWAGRFRDVNVQVGSHTPPPYYEVPIHMRQFCDDLNERLLHLNQDSVENCAEFLAWADWRFQWIHPFKDFNGRIGRIILAAMLYKLALPHVETAPTDPTVRRNYLDALQTADQGELDPLAQMWIRRVEETL